MKWDLKSVLYLLVGVAGVLALLAKFGVSLGLPAMVGEVGGWLMIAGAILWGLKALGKEVL